MARSHPTSKTKKLTISGLSMEVYRHILADAKVHGGLSDSAMARLILARHYQAAQEVA